jgi:uncharacterized protein (DUF362 family)
MASPVRLEKGRLTSAFFKAFTEYYSSINGGCAYAAKRWEEWKGSQRLTRYIATKNGKVVGWMIYDEQRSTILEILGAKTSKARNPIQQMIDSLILKESLLAVEILKEDVERYDWMVEYGFRPTVVLSRESYQLQRMDLSTSVLLRKVNRSRPARPFRKKERVAIERVGEPQDYEGIKKALEHLITKLGGLKRFVSPGQTVAIKPNIVSDHGLKDGLIVGGIVTDIRVIRALVELLLPVAGKVIIAEGSSINRSETAKMFTHYGYDEIVKLNPAKVSLVDLNTDDLVEKTVPHGKRMVSRKVPVTLERADVIISVPVMKIHFAAVASLSIKNLQGAMPPLEKYMTHFFGLWQNLVNIHHVVKPKLIIVDGLTGLEGFGPISGTPKPMNLLIGGTNPVAVDATTMRVMGIDPLSSPPLWLAYMQGFGPVEVSKIDLVGPTIEEVAKPFKQPLIDIAGGRAFHVHASEACSGCSGYLHFVLAKLRKTDPEDPDRLLIDRPFDKEVNIFLGPRTDEEINPHAQNIFMGLCQQHNAGKGLFLPGCPPHAEVIMNGVFSLYPDVERPKYANKSEEAKLGEMLDQVLGVLQQDS